MAEEPWIERYYGADVPAAAIPAMGYAAQRTARPGLRPHSHAVFELCLIERGTLEWFHGDRRYRLPPGSLFAARPSTRHGAVGGVVQPSAFWWVQIDPDRLPNEALAAALRKLPVRAAVAGQEPIRLHEQILDECRARRPDGARMADALVGAFVARVAREAGTDPERARQPAALKRALEAIEAAPAHPWRVEELQARAGVGRSRLFALFRDRFGQSPAAYARARRLREAQQRLRATSRPVTEIAHELGFSSSQHFATAFRQHYGMSPAEYRRVPVP